MGLRIGALVLGLSLAGCGGSTQTVDAGAFPDSGAQSSGSSGRSGSLSSSSGGATAETQCPGASLPKALRLDLTGFVACTCLEGTFTLDLQASSFTGETVWSSGPVTGCPGQTGAAYLKLLADSNGFSFGITDEGSVPGSGDSDGSPSSTYSCSPFTVKGGPSQDGNITDVCSGGGGVEDLMMMWSIVAADGDGGTGGSK